MDATIARIEARDPASTRSCSAPSTRRARARGRPTPRSWLPAKPLGPLHGVPTAIKDLFDFKPGWPATFGGIPALRDQGST